MDITRTCPLCNTTNVKTIDVTLQQFFNWSEGGALIQNAMPNLTPDEREHIKTGICSECWPIEELDNER